MNLKISLLSFVLMALPVCSEAQTARNPLNLEPAQVSLQKRISSWRLADETFYHADGSQFDKRSYVYDEYGRQIADVTLQWNKADNTWRNTMQTEYLYEKDKEITIARSIRQSMSKTETVSDSEGKPVYSLTCLWNKNTEAWSVNPYQRCEWVYDDNGRVQALMKQYKNRTSNEWDDYSVRILYAYDREGVINEELFQTWNAETGQWTNRGKYSYSFLNEHQKAAISYIYASGDWIVDGKTIYFSDEEGKITRCEFFKHTDETLAAFSLITYSESIELPTIIESNEINVYPNPVISSFELTAPDEYVGKTMQLFNVSGNMVKSMPIHTQHTQVEVSGLPNGVYLLKIGEITKRIIIK